MSEQELALLKQLEEKKRSSSEDFLYLYLKAQQADAALPADREAEDAHR